MKTKQNETELKDVENDYYLKTNNKELNKIIEDAKKIQMLGIKAIFDDYEDEDEDNFY